jgi:aldose 1-epimerase
MDVRQFGYGALLDGTPVDAFTVRNTNGMAFTAITYGGIVVSIETPDRRGATADVVLGFGDLAGYLGDHPYVGAIVGRYANRIAKGMFTLDGTAYTLATNNPPNHLHGGNQGFDAVIWNAEPIRGVDSSGVTLRYTSPDGDEGYPGNLAVTVAYTLTNDNALTMDYHAHTDAPTPVNLTQHTYFNLSGDPTRDVLDHVVCIDADRFTPVDSTLVPTGALASVAGTPFDFTTPHSIGARIADDHEQLQYGSGYDHNFVLGIGKTPLERAAFIEEPSSGRTLEVSTTEPGVQFYTGNFLDGSLIGKGGRPYPRRSGFCLETQHFPDSPNHPAFPSTILRPGEEYRSRTVWRFGITP